MNPGFASPRLLRLVRSVTEQERAPREEVGQCGLCAAPVPPEHRHLLDVQERTILCACRACAILFEAEPTRRGHYRLTPDRHRRIEGFRLSEADWAELSIPVDLAFFFYSSAADRVVACYPGPAGVTESALPLTGWDRLVRENPVLQRLEPEVEGLLIDRAEGAREHWIVPLDACYRLAGMIRTRWRGLGGGPELRQEVARYFEELRRGSERVRYDGTPAST